MEHKLNFYRSGSTYYFEIDGTFYNGKIILGKGNHGGEVYEYVDYLDWDSDEHENAEEIEEYIENNLYNILKNAEQL